MNKNLERLIFDLETRLAVVEETYPGGVAGLSGSAWKARSAAYEAIVNDLVHDERAKYRAGLSDAFMLEMGGIRVTATGGNCALVNNWLRRAKAASQEGVRAA